MEDLKYDQWQTYFGDYEKNECDIKLHSGEIIKHVYPNAGMFNKVCGDGYRGEPIDGKHVAEIMYREYYLKDLCIGDCNMENKKLIKELHQAEDLVDELQDEVDRKMFRKKQDPKAIIHPVRTTPKIGRNEQCPCESGKKYKNCCIKN